MASPQLVAARYAEALASGALLYLPTQLCRKPESGLVFEVRLVTQLAQKPATAHKGVDPNVSRTNPFLPYDERLFVMDVGNEHVLLLNKFCVVPCHTLLVTRAFKPQDDPLEPLDLASAIDILQA